MIALRHTTIDRTPLDEWSARRRNLYLSKHNTHARLWCSRRNSNPQFLQASGRRPKSHTARPPGSVVCTNKQETEYLQIHIKLAQTGSPGNILFAVLLTAELPPHKPSRSKLQPFSNILNSTSKFQIQEGRVQLVSYWRPTILEWRVKTGVRGCTVSWGTVLQAWRSPCQFPMGFFIELTVPSTLWPSGQLRLDQGYLLRG